MMKTHTICFLLVTAIGVGVLAAALVGALCSTIGVFVVLRGLAFVGAGTAHAAFAGVALGFLMGWPPLLMAMIFGLATVWITGWVEEKGRMKLDVVDPLAEAVVRVQPRGVAIRGVGERERLGTT